MSNSIEKNTDGFILGQLAFNRLKYRIFRQFNQNSV